MATDYAKLKVTELRAELKKLGLASNGFKADLVKRLEAAMNQARDVSGSETAAETKQATDEEVPAASKPSVDVESSSVGKRSAYTEPATVEETTESQRANGSVNGDDEAGEAVLKPKQLANEAVLSSASSQLPANDKPNPSKATAGQLSTKDTTEDGHHSNDIFSSSTTATTARILPNESPQPDASASVRSTDATPVPSTEMLQDSQKRKRRSLSPTPTPADVARKRIRHVDEGEDNDDAGPSDTNPNVGVPATNESLGALSKDTETAGPVDVEDTRANLQNESYGDLKMEDPPCDVSAPGDPMIEDTEAFEHKPDVQPSIHPATAGLYIKNFMRPLRPQAVEDHLVDLATPYDQPLDANIIVEFYLDSIRTHALVVFSSVSAASRVRAALHNRVWPNETNRRPLWVDYFPPENFKTWVEMEEGSGGSRGGTNKYELVYDSHVDGNMTVRLEESDGALPAARPSSQSRKLSIPTGPRALSGVQGAPLGPRAFQHNEPAAFVHPTRAGKVDSVTTTAATPADTTGDLVDLTTRAYPPVLYRPVSEDLVDRRLTAISAAKTKDMYRDFGKEYKRYYFERGDVLVDRGPEIFLGIRPPHRERERRREIGAGGGSGDRPPLGRGGMGSGPRGGFVRGPGRGFGSGYGGSFGGRRRRGEMPMHHGVPRGGDRYRGPASSGRPYDDRASDRFRSERGTNYDRY